MFDAAIQDFADAIAYAEGAYTSGSRANRNNNPGDLTLDLTGKGIGFDGPFVIYAAWSDGWEALVRQVEMMLTNTSGIYNDRMSIWDVAVSYAEGDLDWARNVASRLGVDPATRLYELVQRKPVVSALAIPVLLVLMWFFKRKG